MTTARELDLSTRRGASLKQEPSLAKLRSVYARTPYKTQTKLAHEMSRDTLYSNSVQPKGANNQTTIKSKLKSNQRKYVNQQVLHDNRARARMIKDTRSIEHLAKMVCKPKYMQLRQAYDSVQSFDAIGDSQPQSQMKLMENSDG